MATAASSCWTREASSGWPTTLRGWLGPSGRSIKKRLESNGNSGRSQTLWRRFCKNGVGVLRNPNRDDYPRRGRPFNVVKASGGINWVLANVFGELSLFGIRNKELLSRKNYEQ